MSMHDMGKGEFPVGRARRREEIGAHFFGEREGGGSEASPGMRFSEQHQRAHMVELVADVLPMPGGGVGGVEQFLTIDLRRGEFRKCPGGVVCRGAEKAMPASGIGVGG